MIATILQIFVFLRYLEWLKCANIYVKKVNSLQFMQFLGEPHDIYVFISTIIAVVSYLDVRDERRKHCYISFIAGVRFPIAADCELK